MQRLESVRVKVQELYEQFLLEADKNPFSSMPLVCPWTVKRMAEILNIDIVSEYYQVPNIKTFLKTFLLQYRLEGLVSSQEIQSCLEMVLHANQKHKSSDISFGKNINSYDKNVENYCVECNLIAVKYCTDCKDALCEDCCARLHAKGTRVDHWINKIIRCSMCTNFPSRLQCTCTFETFCLECYSRHHVKTLPQYLDLKPLRIDYSLRVMHTQHVKHLGDVLHASLHKNITHELQVKPKLLTTDWHPFLDSLGVEYHYNFKTEESVRHFTNLADEPKSKNSDRLDKCINKIKFDISGKVLPDKLTHAQCESLLET